jgi:hypothetical protein
LERSDSAPAPAAAVVRPFSSTASLEALLTHAHEYSPSEPGRRHRMLAAYLEVAARVPIIEVAFRRDLKAFDALLDRIIDVAGLDPQLTR